MNAARREEAYTDTLWSASLFSSNKEGPSSFSTCEGTLFIDCGKTNRHFIFVRMFPRFFSWRVLVAIVFLGATTLALLFMRVRVIETRAMVSALAPTRTAPSLAEIPPAQEVDVTKAATIQKLPKKELVAAHEIDLQTGPRDTPAF